MPRVEMSRLPDSARLWVFAAHRALTAHEAATLLQEVDGFLDRWAAHGVPLTNARDWRYDQFLLVAVDEAAAGVSGCSIDALVHSLKALEQRLGIVMLDNGPVTYRDGDRITRVPRGRFAQLADAGTVGPDTTVFDNTVTTVGAVRSGKWETPARNSWHGRAFFRDAPRQV
jgi:hypothetical protein